MIKNPALAKEIIEAARAGVAEYAKHNKNKKSHNKKLSPIPVSVKTRLGYATADIEQWLGFLLEQNLPALTVHLRTRKEMSDVSAHWELMPEIVRLRDTIMSPSMSPLPSSSLSPCRTIILGNGDVTDCVDATAKAAASGADGVMFGRAIFGNPWLFNRLPHKNFDSISITDRLNVMVEHTFLFEKMFAGVKNFSIMKKHYKAYVNGWDGAKDVRMKLMDAQSAREVAEIVQKYLKK
jgi:tRNA-dihydrouridine synthase